MEYKGARIFNVILGAWLLLTPSFWPHTFAQSVNTAIVRLLALVVVADRGDGRAKGPGQSMCVSGTWLVISAFAMQRDLLGTPIE